MYVVTGNGTFDAQNGGHDYGDSVLKLKPDLSAVVDYFSPFLSDYQGVNFLADWDEDLGSSGATMIPGTTLLLASGKMGNGYLVDTANLGKWSPGGDAVVQKLRISWPSGQTKCDPDDLSTAMVFSTPVVLDRADSTGAVHTHVYGGLGRLPPGVHARRKRPVRHEGGLLLPGGVARRRQGHVLRD